MAVEASRLKIRKRNLLLVWRFVRMSVLPLLRTLDLYKGKHCKVVFRDGGAAERVKVFRGVLEAYDHKFQIWAGHPDKLPAQKCKLALNHDDVNRIVLESVGA